MDNVENAAIIAAVVQAIKSLVPAQVVGWVTVVVAAIVGACLAYVQGAELINGIYQGLVAAGVVTVASKIGK